jgi:hypothetical protein
VPESSVRRDGGTEGSPGALGGGESEDVLDPVSIFSRSVVPRRCSVRVLRKHKRWILFQFWYHPLLLIRCRSSPKFIPCSKVWAPVLERAVGMHLPFCKGM